MAEIELNKKEMDAQAKEAAQALLAEIEADKETRKMSVNMSATSYGELLDTRLDKSKPVAYRPLPGFEINPLMKFPRNHLCFCGSMKKFKKCHDGKIPLVLTKDQAQRCREVMKFYGVA